MVVRGTMTRETREPLADRHFVRGTEQVAVGAEVLGAPSVPSTDVHLRRQLMEAMRRSSGNAFGLTSGEMSQSKGPARKQDFAGEAVPAWLDTWLRSEYRFQVFATDLVRSGGNVSWVQIREVAREHAALIAENPGSVLRSLVQFGAIATGAYTVGALLGLGPLGLYAVLGWYALDGYRAGLEAMQGYGFRWADAAWAANGGDIAPATHELTEAGLSALWAFINLLGAFTSVKLAANSLANLRKGAPKPQGDVVDAQWVRDVAPENALPAPPVTVPALTSSVVHPPILALPAPAAQSAAPALASVGLVKGKDAAPRSNANAYDGFDWSLLDWFRSRLAGLATADNPYVSVPKPSGLVPPTRSPLDFASAQVGPWLIAPTQRPEPWLLAGKPALEMSGSGKEDAKPGRSGKTKRAALLSNSDKGPKSVTDPNVGEISLNTTSLRQALCQELVKRRDTWPLKDMNTFLEDHGYSRTILRAQISALQSELKRATQGAKPGGPPVKLGTIRSQGGSGYRFDRFDRGDTGLLPVTIQGVERWLKLTSEEQKLLIHLLSNPGLPIRLHGADAARLHNIRLALEQGRAVNDLSAPTEAVGNFEYVSAAKRAAGTYVFRPHGTRAKATPDDLPEEIGAGSSQVRAPERNDRHPVKRDADDQFSTDRPPAKLDADGQAPGSAKFPTAAEIPALIAKANASSEFGAVTATAYENNLSPMALYEASRKLGTPIELHPVSPAKKLNIVIELRVHADTIASLSSYEQLNLKEAKYREVAQRSGLHVEVIRSWGKGFFAAEEIMLILRDRGGRSDQELARDVGVTPSAISKWQREYGNVVGP